MGTEGAPLTQELQGAWRRMLLLGLPVVQLSILAALLFARPDVWDTHYDPPLYLAMSALLLVCWLATLRSWASIRQITLAVTAGSGLFLSAKLLLLGFVLRDPYARVLEVLETLVWLPTVITWTMLTDLAREVRRVLGALLWAVALCSLMIVLWPVVQGEALPVDLARALLQINLSAAVSLYGASFFMQRNDALGRLHGEQRVLQQLVYTDLLTGLPGRVRLHEQLEQLAAQQTPFAVLFVDVDAFKVINDTLGHAAGDDLLRGLARELQRLAGEGAQVFRLSGDEFVVLLPDTREPEAHALAGHLLQAPLAPSRHVGVDATVSIGLSLYPDDAQHPGDLLRHADSAMYAVKRAGRRQVRRYHPQQDAATERFQVLARDLGNALGRAELSLRFQPIYRLRDLRLVKAEALLRWTHPTLGPVPPSEFIPVAERVGLIMPVGTWVLQTACEAARGWPGVRVSVNVSPVQLLQADFAQTVRAALQRTGLRPRRLELELTETAVLYEDDRVARTLQELRDLGVRISIDDFGSGYSNLARLRTMPITGVKLDRSIIVDLPHDQNGGFARALTRAALDIAAHMRVDLTAEGIETCAHLEMLRALDCPLGQGHGLCRPITAEELGALLRAAHAEPARAT
ncbi:putative bifunctional diguanylate cyclase/phosphodiesterase [Deinococcus arcticus]|uniref:GGDEF-domain containing protein n=1 Tax=Deinococcus arcticus TaxID=2136176 RepID=A0A2T3W831_9DEIO|nr:EAL domain-containing protein [Deinococcus arcticus]PTA67954.1 GGDEF-domain containing protein [Deinococcus arcticus]